MATIDSTATNIEGGRQLVIDRDTASSLNPLIGDDVEETLDQCQRAITDIGYVMSYADEMSLNFDIKDFFRLFEVAASAMRYEIASIQQGEKA